MKSYAIRFSPHAGQDLKDLREYLAEERGKRFANRYVTDLIDYLEGFDVAPVRGSAIAMTGVTVRLVGWKGAVTIAFRVDEAAARVDFLAILGRGRDIEAVLRKRL